MLPRLTNQKSGSATNKNFSEKKTGNDITI